jgi:hypothetical protein
MFLENVSVLHKCFQKFQKFTNESKVRHNVQPQQHGWLVECSVAHNLRSWIDGKAQLGLLAVLHREALHEQGCEPRPCTAAEGVEHQEPLCAFRCWKKQKYKLEKSF